jgi:hypothetical protein
VTHHRCRRQKQIHKQPDAPRNHRPVWATSRERKNPVVRRPDPRHSRGAEIGPALRTE